MTVSQLTPLTKERCRELKWYNALMTSEERRDRYLLLRLSGATRGQAQRWRDYSKYHFGLMLTYLEKQSSLESRSSLTNAPT